MAGGAKFHDSCHSGSGSGYGNMVSLLELLNKWQEAFKKSKRDYGDFIGNNIVCGRVGRVLKKGGYGN